MPTYNDANYLPEAIESILKQTYQDFEFIIINDRSTDNTAEILTGYQQQDERIIVLNNSKNLGVARSLNRGIKIARGEYIARMDSDDVSLPQRFERQIVYLEAHPEIGVLGTQLVFIDESGELAPEYKWQPPTSSSLTIWHMLYSTTLCHPSLMMRLSCLDTVDGYDADYANEDAHLFMNLAFVTKLTNLDEVLIEYRIQLQHQKQKTSDWEQHTQRVSHEYVEKILNHTVELKWIEILFNFIKYSNFKPQTTLLEVFQLASLLKEIFDKMKYHKLLDENGAKEVEQILISQSQRLMLTAYKTIRYN